MNALIPGALTANTTVVLAVVSIVAFCLAVIVRQLLSGERSVKRDLSSLPAPIGRLVESILVELSHPGSSAHAPPRAPPGVQLLPIESESDLPRRCRRRRLDPFDRPDRF